MKKYDIVAIGEVLVDFTYAGKSENGMSLFEQNPGGAPANVAGACAKLGMNAGFIGKVGRDIHGDFLVKTLSDCGVDTRAVVYDKKAPTTLAYVSLDESGERSFSFSRNNSADVSLKAEELDRDMLVNTKILHFGSLSLTDEPVRSATLEACRIAKENGAIITYDPNYRPLLWDSEKEAVEKMKSVLGIADIIKISDEEMPLICGTVNVEKAAEMLYDMGIKVVVITLGADGVYVYGKFGGVKVRTEKVKVVDTTGAGDSFFGAFLQQLATKGILPEAITLEQARECAQFANHAAAVCVSGRGAIPSMLAL